MTHRCSSGCAWLFAEDHFMPLGKFIVLLGIIAIVGWALHFYQGDIGQGIGWVSEQEVSAWTKAEGYYHTFKYEEAVAAYREAISRGLEEPRKREAYFRLAIALDKAHHKAEALAAYREAVKLYPNSDDAQRSQGAMERLRLETGN